VTTSPKRKLKNEMSLTSKRLIAINLM